ncbi:MAG: hypothetical protein JW779_14615 [Candidatus Thorarchaeota archaeon]|nr:hypothetical protein [Candidatus Thorarchaeota archaeon]
MVRGQRFEPSRWRFFSIVNYFSATIGTTQHSISKVLKVLWYPFYGAHLSQNIAGRDGSKNERGKSMQEIPTIEPDYPLSPLELGTAIVILVLLVVVLGYTNRTTRPRYWIIASIEVVVFTVSWLFLVLLTDLIVYTHISLPIDIKPIVIQAAKIISYLGFCILLVYIEMRRELTKTKHEKTQAIIS